MCDLEHDRAAVLSMYDFLLVVHSNILVDWIPYTL